MDRPRSRFEQAARERGKWAARRWGISTAGLRRLPDFLIIGTKRGGTTSLWNWLIAHPNVLRPWPGPQHIKSSHYFYQNYALGEAWYRSFFPLRSTDRLVNARLGSSPVVGEASPYYLYDPRVPARVETLLPHVRVVVLLRNPVDRAYSHYMERVKSGVERLSFADALAAEPGRLAGELERMADEPMYYSRAHDWFSYRDRGVYEPQIRRWRSFVPDERLLILRSEDLYEDPAATYAKVLRFLGLPSHSAALPHLNSIVYHDMDQGVQRELADFYEPSVTSLEHALGRKMGWELMSRPATR